MSLKQDVNTVEQPASSNVNKSGNISHSRKKKIVRDIERLNSKQDYIALFKIINKVTDKYTQNKNGIFINLNCLSDSTLLEIETFLRSTKPNASVEFSQLHLGHQSLKSMQHKSRLSCFTKGSRGCKDGTKGSGPGVSSLSESALSVSEGILSQSSPSSPSPPRSPSMMSIHSMKLTNYEKNIVKRHRDFYSEQSSDSEFYTL